MTPKMYQITLAKSGRRKIIWRGWGALGFVSFSKNGKLFHGNARATPAMCVHFLNNVTDDEDLFHVLIATNADAINDFFTRKSRALGMTDVTTTLRGAYVIM